MFFWGAVAVFAALSSAAAMADERIKFDDKDYDAHKIRAFERAVGVNPVDVRDGDQVRLWYIEPMGGHVTGFVVSTTGVWRCSLDYTYVDGGFVVHPGKCGTRRRHPKQLAEVHAMLDGMAAFNGQSLACDDVMDGWIGDVNGMRNGVAFAFSIGNNNECEDPASQRIMKFTDAVDEAYAPDKED